MRLGPFRNTNPRSVHSSISTSPQTVRTTARARVRAALFKLTRIYLGAIGSRGRAWKGARRRRECCRGGLRFWISSGEGCRAPGGCGCRRCATRDALDPGQQCGQIGIFEHQGDDCRSEKGGEEGGQPCYSGIISRQSLRLLQSTHSSARHCTRPIASS